MLWYKGVENMNCLWILILLCLCNNRNDGCDERENCRERKNCHERENRHEREERRESEDCREERREEREERRWDREERRREDDCGCDNGRTDRDDGNFRRRFMNDDNLFDMPRGEGRMPSNFQRGTCGCEMKDE